MTEADILFVDDISRLFSISQNTIQRRKWREQTGMPLHKIGKKLCGFKREIEEWAKSK
ncbi:MAG: transcriptional regulator [Candidatus Omnitrophica bacterium]|nr:transcriptional regulator [Candidatus Omnitrophota bacterium]